MVFLEVRKIIAFSSNIELGNRRWWLYLDNWFLSKVVSESTFGFGWSELNLFLDIDVFFSNQSYNRNQTIFQIRAMGYCVDFG